MTILPSLIHSPMSTDRENEKPVPTQVNLVFKSLLKPFLWFQPQDDALPEKQNPNRVCFRRPQSVASQ
jgi:hypothetical protein